MVNFIKKLFCLPKKQDISSNFKGYIGELQLSESLKQIFPNQRLLFNEEYTLSSGIVCPDVRILFKDKQIIIDSKNLNLSSTHSNLISRIKSEARDVYKKYSLIDDLPILALLVYIPNVDTYNIIINEVEFLKEMASKRVFIVGPTSLYYYLYTMSILDIDSSQLALMSERAQLLEEFRTMQAQMNNLSKSNLAQQAKLNQAQETISSLKRRILK